MTKQRSEDFRDWDIDVETNYSGYDKSGFPFCIYRETADSRFMLGRPRYCCVTEQNGELYFTIFNPALDIRPTGAGNVFYIVAALVVIFMLVISYLDRQSASGDYAFNRGTPPAVFVIAMIIYAPLLGALSSVIWQLCTTMYRWVNGRFERDGRITYVPLDSLTGFQVLTASEAGATADKRPARSGHGLSAVFSDGSQIVLTGNAWDYPSIAEQHRVMTREFCSRRDEYVKPWEERNGKAKPKPPPSDDGGASGCSIPYKL